MRSFIRNLNLIGLLAVCFFACNRHSSNLLLQQIDSLLEEKPDSALVLLKNIPAPEEMPGADRAYYALLMAEAADKNELSLLSCDSLLNAALHYYHDHDKEMAVALLYKGRLEVEMKSTQEAIRDFQYSLEILCEYPEESELKMLVYSSLGNLYLNINLYDKSLEMLKSSFRCNPSLKNKSSILNAISFDYCMLGKKDSALNAQYEALKYAVLSGDSSLIIDSKHNLSLSFYEFDEVDSSMCYARSVLQELPFIQKNKGNYYYNIGNLLLEKDQYDSAAYYLLKGLNNTSIKGKAQTFKALCDLEKELGNYEKAYYYLENYVVIVDSLADAEQVSEMEHLVYKYETKMQVKREKAKARRVLGRFIFGGIMVCFFIILVFQNRIHRKKCLQLYYKQSLEQTRNKLSSLQIIIEDNQEMIFLLQQGHDNKDAEITQREQTIEHLKDEALKLRSWLFEQTDLYRKIISLSQKKVPNKKEMRALTTTEQDKLKQMIFEIFADYIVTIRTEYPKLTDADLLFLCLQQTSLSSLSVAICFGYTDTQAINQRKSRLKEKMR